VITIQEKNVMKTLKKYTEIQHHRDISQAKDLRMASIVLIGYKLQSMQ
jgi:hypothetical protein